MLIALGWSQKAHFRFTPKHYFKYKSNFLELLVSSDVKCQKILLLQQNILNKAMFDGVFG